MKQNTNVKWKKHYNQKVKNASFKVGEYVLRDNAASRAEPTGKLSVNWEGPYQLVEILEKGAYRLARIDGKLVPRTCNVA